MFDLVSGETLSIIGYVILIAGGGLGFIFAENTILKIVLLFVSLFGFVGLFNSLGIEFDGVVVGFLIFSGLALMGGLGVVTTRNLFRGTIWLMVSLFGVAGLFVLLSAPFLAAVQVLVYIGAIAILITFAVMLTRSVTQLQLRYNRAGYGVVGSVVLFVILLLGVVLPVWGNSYLTPVTNQVSETVDLGIALVDGNGFVLPFEVASLLLTAAMIGAIVIAREEKA